MASFNEAIEAGLEDLQKAHTEVIVEATKAIRDSVRDSGGSHAATVPSLDISSRLGYPTFDFHTALDDIEREITRAMAVRLRDLKELRERRMKPPAAGPSTVSAPGPVAAPAPQTIRSDPAASKATPSTGNAAITQYNAGPAHPSKQDSKPPAPVPDMGIDLTISPEVRPSPSPALSQAKAKQVKSSPKTSPTASAAKMAATSGRPVSAPPKKDGKAGQPSTTPKTVGSTPQAPVHAVVPPVAPPAPMMEAPMMDAPMMDAPMMDAPMMEASTNSSTSGPPHNTGVPVPQAHGPPPEAPAHGMFTNMAFSVDPGPNESTHSEAPATQVSALAPAAQQPVADNNSNLSMDAFGGPADMSNDFNMSGFDPGMLDLNSGMMNDSNNVDSLLGHDGSNNAALGASDFNNASVDHLLDLDKPIPAEQMDLDYALGDVDQLDNSFGDIDWGDTEFGEAYTSDQ